MSVALTAIAREDSSNLGEEPLDGQRGQQLFLHGARLVLENAAAGATSLKIVGGRVANIFEHRSSNQAESSDESIDLSGFQLFPGLINAHDHLQYALFPRLGSPPYRNYVEWGEDIHRKQAGLIAQYKQVPKEDRLWWGGLRNLLCGVTTVCHHDPLWPALLRDDFPVRVVSDIGWAHSVEHGRDIKEAFESTPKHKSFIIHAAEGIDQRAGGEVLKLDALGILSRQSVLVHGIGMNSEGVALVRKRGASLILCPSSNRFLFGVLPDISLLGGVGRLALGSDSPLTSVGDFLDEIRFCIRHCKISAQAAYRMATSAAGAILRIDDGRGSIVEGGHADLFAVRNTGESVEARMQKLTIHDIEFVMVGGEIKLVSPRMLERIPCGMRRGLEPLQIDGSIRWLRAPVNALMRSAERVLGEGKVHLGYRIVSVPSGVEEPHGC